MTTTTIEGPKEQTLSMIFHPPPLNGGGSAALSKFGW